MPENASQDGIASYQTLIGPRPTDQGMSIEERRRLMQEGSFGDKAYALAYHVGDNLIGFDDAYQTRGEALGKGIGTFAQNLVSDPRCCGRCCGVYGRKLYECNEPQYGYTTKP
jgi:hypothetical protein